MQTPLVQILYQMLAKTFYPLYFSSRSQTEAHHSILFSSIQFSHSVVSDSWRPHEPQHTSPPCPSPTPRVHPNPCPSSQWCHQPSHPLSSPSPPALNLSQHQGLFKWVSSSHHVAKVLEFQLQHQSFQWTILYSIFNIVGHVIKLSQKFVEKPPHQAWASSILTQQVSMAVSEEISFINPPFFFISMTWTMDLVCKSQFWFCSLKTSITERPHSQSVQWFRHVRLFVTPWTTARQASLSLTIS